MNEEPLNDETPRRLVSIKEACQYGRISRSTLYTKLNAGTVMAYKRGGKTMVDLNSIDAMHAALPAYTSTGAAKA